jgi:hypothetical protein
MKTNLKGIIKNTLFGFMLLFSCFYMYDFYKCLSGFIANGFREPLTMLPMILSFLLPVACFFYLFYDFYVKSVHRVAKIVISAFIILYAILCLVFIFMNIGLYASNNRFGVYDALPSIIVHFPYDMIIVHFGIIALFVFNIVLEFINGTKCKSFVDSLKSYGFFKLHIAEYIALCILGIVVFVFSGSGVTAIFTSFSNAFYNYRYIFLLLWVLFIPMMNLLFLVFKPERLNLPFKAKIAIISSGIGINLLFGALLLIFERTYPDFIVHIGKPLFLIAFSVSLPIEMCVILGIMALGTILMITMLILTIVKNRK